MVRGSVTWFRSKVLLTRLTLDLIFQEAAVTTQEDGEIVSGSEVDTSGVN